MRILSTLAVCGGLALLAACGGGDSVQGPPVQGPTESGQSPTLDFSAIAGEWEGTWTLPNGVSGGLEGSLNSSAGTGAAVGTADWFFHGELDCRVDWIAVSAEPPTYVVEEDVTVNASGGCTEGRITFEHDAATQTLDFLFEGFTGPDAVGTLSRRN